MEPVFTSRAGMAMATAPYTNRAPSPPLIQMPIPRPATMELKPSSRYLAALGLTRDELEAITHGGEPLTVTDKAPDWDYENRRKAQSILDWLHLGPTQAARDQAYLQKSGITMVLAIRLIPNGASLSNPHLAMTSTAATAKLGISVETVMIQDGSHSAINAFSQAIEKINAHVLRRLELCRTNKGYPLNETGHDAKVLVACETGNGLSALVVAAYIMAMFDKDIVDALTCISLSRFSTSPDDDQKRQLQTWGDILKATNHVAQQKPRSGGKAASRTRKKRVIGETYESEDDSEPGGRLDASASSKVLAQVASDDTDRFANRESFSPFVDSSMDLDG